jgi:hypothetical protein
MQLSQFEKEGRLELDGSVTVSGSVAPETDENGKVVPRETLVRFHFLVVQGDHVLSGESASLVDKWVGTTSEGDPGFTTGPALAIGLGVEVKRAPSPSFDCFTWAEEVNLTASG